MLLLLLFFSVGTFVLTFISAIGPIVEQVTKGKVTPQGMNIYAYDTIRSNTMMSKSIYYSNDLTDRTVL